jgi:hypothetical protein
MKSIKISNNIYVHVFLHKINKTLEEAVLESEEYNILNYDKIAMEYIDALDENYCVALLEALHKISACKIVEHWEEVSPKQLDKKRYKKYLKFKI